MSEDSSSVVPPPATPPTTATPPQLTEQSEPVSVSTTPAPVETTVSPPKSPVRSKPSVLELVTLYNTPITRPEGAIPHPPLALSSFGKKKKGLFTKNKNTTAKVAKDRIWNPLRVPQFLLSSYPVYTFAEGQILKKGAKLGGWKKRPFRVSSAGILEIFSDPLKPPKESVPISLCEFDVTQAKEMPVAAHAKSLRHEVCLFIKSDATPAEIKKNYSHTNAKGIFGRVFYITAHSKAELEPILSSLTILKLHWKGREIAQDSDLQNSIQIKTINPHPSVNGAANKKTMRVKKIVLPPSNLTCFPTHSAYSQVDLKSANMFEKRTYAAVILQRYWRTNLANRVVKRRRNVLIINNWAAGTIQKIARGYLARKHLRDQRAWECVNQGPFKLKKTIPTLHYVMSQCLADLDCLFSDYFDVSLALRIGQTMLVSRANRKSQPFPPVPIEILPKKASPVLELALIDHEPLTANAARAALSLTSSTAAHATAAAAAAIQQKSSTGSFIKDASASRRSVDSHKSNGSSDTNGRSPSPSPSNQVSTGDTPPAPDTSSTTIASTSTSTATTQNGNSPLSGNSTTSSETFSTERDVQFSTMDSNYAVHPHDWVHVKWFDRSQWRCEFESVDPSILPSNATPVFWTLLMESAPDISTYDDRLLQSNTPNIKELYPYHDYKYPMQPWARSHPAKSNPLQTGHWRTEEEKSKGVFSTPMKVNPLICLILRRREKLVTKKKKKVKVSSESTSSSTVKGPILTDEKLNGEAGRILRSLVSYARQYPRLTLSHPSPSVHVDFEKAYPAEKIAADPYLNPDYTHSIALSPWEHGHPLTSNGPFFSSPLERKQLIAVLNENQFPDNDTLQSPSGDMIILTNNPDKLPKTATKKFKHLEVVEDE